MSTIYTAKEVAKKLKVSEGHVYELVKRGDLKKVEGLGRIVRIPGSELNNVTSRDCFKYNPDKVEAIETSLGKVRKIKNEDWYLILDICNCVGIKDSWTIKKCSMVRNNQTKLLSMEECRELGLISRTTGILFITLNGIRNYSGATRVNTDWNKFIKELSGHKKTLAEGVQALNSKTGLQIIEQREVLGKEFRIYGDLENPLFLAKDVAEWIEHSDTSTMIRNVDDEEKVTNNVCTLGGIQEAWFLTEDGVYEVLMQSRKPIAKQFKKEVKKILKQIRLTGGYVGNEVKFVANYFNNFSKETKKVMIDELESKNKELFVEKDKIDNALLTNIETIKLLEK